MLVAIATVALGAVLAICFLRAAKRHRPQRISPERTRLLRMNPRTRQDKAAYMKALQRYRLEDSVEDLHGRH